METQLYQVNDPGIWLLIFNTQIGPAVLRPLVITEEFLQLGTSGREQKDLLSVTES